MHYIPPSEETLRALETVPDMYLILSPELIILTASDLYLEATNSRREVIKGKPIFEAFPSNPYLSHADRVQNIKASLLEVIQTKKPHYMQVQRYDVPDLHHPGQFIERYWEAKHTPVLTPGGEIFYIIQQASNVTEKVLADSAFADQKIEHQKLITSETHFKHLADLVPAKISNALPSGEVTFFNQHWLDYAGMNFEDLRDFGYFQMMHPEEIAAFQMQLGEAAAKGIALESEMRFKDINGNYRWHLNIASPILNENGEITMWVGSTTDIQRIKDEEKRKTNFIGVVSHELKTPLTSLNAYLQVLLSKASKADDAFAVAALEKSINQVKKMSVMINGFLNVSRLENAKIHIDKQPFDMTKLLKDVESQIAATVNSHVIKFSQPLKKLKVVADRDKIEQVIHNLIGNAIKYSPIGTKIDIACSQINKTLQFTVADQGYGVRPEDREKLFDLYYRVENDESKNISGFGIGLYLCSEIIKLHEGKIWVESNLAEGSRFYFCLPLA